MRFRAENPGSHKILPNRCRFPIETLPFQSYISYRAILAWIAEDRLLALTRKTDYALVALSELARHAPDTVCARKLSDLTSIPLPVLSTVLNQLVHHNLVVSIRGVQGGYRLARSADSINLVDVVHAIDGVPRLTQCCSGENEHHGEDPCKLEPKCRINGPMQRVHRGLQEFMSRIVLAHIAFDMVPVNLDAKARK